MYERFTDRARMAVRLANQEAQRLNHEWVGTGHILLGLVKEGSGIAANALKGLGVDLRRVRLEAQRLEAYEAKGECVALGKLPHSERAKAVVEQAVYAARDLGHDYVGTEHLCLGLLRIPECSAAKVLTALGVTADALRAEVMLLLGVRIVPAAGVVTPEPRRPASATPGAAAYVRRALNRLALVKQNMLEAEALLLTVIQEMTATKKEKADGDRASGPGQDHHGPGPKP